MEDQLSPNTFDNVSIFGNSVGGTWFPVLCLQCGASIASAPFADVDSMVLIDSEVTCAKCQKLAIIVDGEFRFQRVAFSILIRLGESTRRHGLAFAAMNGKHVCPESRAKPTHCPAAVFQTAREGPASGRPRA